MQKQQEVLNLLTQRNQQEYLLLINLVSKFARNGEKEPETAKPAEVRPAEPAKPAEAKAAEPAKPAETKPAATKPAETKSTESAQTEPKKKPVAKKRETDEEKARPLADLERAMGFRSSFNFIPEGGYKTPADLREELVSGVALVFDEAGLAAAHVNQQADGQR